MNTVKKQAAVAALSAILFGVASPASAAWEFERQSEEGFGGTEHTHIATVNAQNGAGKLQLGCKVGIFQVFSLTVHTGEAYDATASYAASVPLMILADETEKGIPAVFGNRDGELVVEAGHAHDSGIKFEDVAAIRDASASLEVSFFQTRLSFPSDNAENAVGQVIDACW